jgi:hypothetical protein
MNISKLKTYFKRLTQRLEAFSEPVIIKDELNEESIPNANPTVEKIKRKHLKKNSTNNFFYYLSQYYYQY